MPFQVRSVMFDTIDTKGMRAGGLKHAEATITPLPISSPAGTLETLTISYPPSLTSIVLTESTDWTNTGSNSGNARAIAAAINRKTTLPVIAEIADPSTLPLSFKIKARTQGPWAEAITVLSSQEGGAEIDTTGSGVGESVTIGLKTYIKVAVIVLATDWVTDADLAAAITAESPNVVAAAVGAGVVEVRTTTYGWTNASLLATYPVSVSVAPAWGGGAWTRIGGAALSPAGQFNLTGVTLIGVNGAFSSTLQGGTWNATGLGPPAFQAWLDAEVPAIGINPGDRLAGSLIIEPLTTEGSSFLVVWEENP